MKSLNKYKISFIQIKTKINRINRVIKTVNSLKI